MASLRTAIRQWTQQVSDDLRKDLEWQFEGRSKYFRPLTIFCCHRAVSKQPIPAILVRTAQVLEMFHNVSLIIDDIVDKSAERRGKETLHTRFGELRALMVSGYIVSDGYDMLWQELLPSTGSAALPPSELTRRLAVADYVSFDTRRLSELMKRLAVAECVQWERRGQPAGVADWEDIAREDTGSMFEVCACLGTRDERLRLYGRYLGMLYHGCDDVADVRGDPALGGGGSQDLRDGILTLPAALAIREPSVRRVFCKRERTPRDIEYLASKFRDQLDEAERHLDGLADKAKWEAQKCSASPDHLVLLVDHTRRLSGS